MKDKNNPFSESFTDKRMFDWLYQVSAERNVEYSLQRYKELFFFFINCFNSGKIELLERDLFNDSWEQNYAETIGCQVFHLAVNCYLYYYGYREDNTLVDLEKKKIAKLLLKKIQTEKSRYLLGLIASNIKENQLLSFLQEVEIITKDRIEKKIIMPEVIKDFIVFSTLISSYFQITNLPDFFKQNINITYYQCYISNETEKKALFRDFYKIFCNDERINIDQIYNLLIQILQRIITEIKIDESNEFLKQYKSKFSEKVLGNEYRKQIEAFLEKSFSPLKGIAGKPFKIKNAILLDYQFLLKFVEPYLSKMSMNALLFNLISLITEFLIKNEIITRTKINIENTKDYLDFLSNNSLDFLIGSQDLLAPHNYKNPILLERYENEYAHLYILSWFRNILALNSNSLSISVTNLRTEFSTPNFEDIKEDYIQDGDYFRKPENAECFTKDELQIFIKNTYRNIKIIADIDLLIDKDAGYLIVPLVS